MATKFSVSCGNTDEQYVTEEKVVRLGTSGEVTFATPLKAGSFGMKDGCSVYEFSRSLKTSTIQKCLQNQSYCSKYERSTRHRRSEDALNLVSFAYDEPSVRPSDDEICIMADMQYACSDVVVVPSWFRLINSEEAPDIELYKEQSLKYLEFASFMNHKPVMASIPVCIPYNRIDETVGLFLDNDVSSFLVDFNARSYDVTWMRRFLRALDEYNIERESVTACINCFQGAAKRGGGRAEALDFMGFFAGFDIICDKHISRRGPGPHDSPHTARMFEESTYSYSQIPYGDERELGSIKAESNRRQVMEMASVRERLRSSVPLTELVREKRIDDEVMSVFRSIRDGAQATTLDRFSDRCPVT